MFKDMNPILKNRFLVSFISKSSSSMLLPFIVIHYTETMNAKIASIFVMITTIAQLIATLYGGFKTDLIGRKKMMVIGELVKVISFFFMIFQFSPYAMFLLVCSVNIAQGLINPAAEAMLIDLSSPKLRPKVFSANYWITNGSIMVGTIVGGWLFTDFLSELLILLFLFSCLTAVLTIFKIKESFEPRIATASETTRFDIFKIFRGYLTVLQNRAFFFYTIGSILVLAVELQRSNVIAIHFASAVSQTELTLPFGLHLAIDGVRLLSLLMTLNTILILLLTPVIIRKFKASRIKSYLVLGVVGYALGYAGLSFLKTSWLLVIAIFILTIGELLYVPAKQSLLAEIIEEENKGTYMAFNGISTQFSRMISGFFLVFVGVLPDFMIAVLIFLMGMLGLFVTQVSFKLKNTEEINKRIREN